MATRKAAATGAQARVLVSVNIDGSEHKTDDVVTLSAEQIESLGGAVDTHPDAVAYALKLK